MQHGEVSGLILIGYLIMCEVWSSAQLLYWVRNLYKMLCLFFVVVVVGGVFGFYFIHERHTQRGRDIEGEAGSLQGAPWRDSIPGPAWAKGRLLLNR